jgi:hypothetical protein
MNDKLAIGKLKNILLDWEMCSVLEKDVLNVHILLLGSTGI